MRLRTAARTGLAIVAGLFAALLIVQVFLAGLGVFDSPTAFATHRDFGYMIELGNRGRIRAPERRDPG